MMGSYFAGASKMAVPVKQTSSVGLALAGWVMLVQSQPAVLASPDVSEVPMRRSLLNPVVLLASSLVFLIGCAPSRSQVPTAPDIGGRVRIKAEGAGQGWVVGQLRELPGDSVRLLTGDPPRDSLAVATGSLTDFERSRGEGTRAAQGAWIGLGVGAFAGIVVGAATYDSEGSFGWDPGASGSALIGGVLVGLLGMGVGALIGTTVQAERWERIPQPWAPPVPGPQHP
jgi:hypothetical protein